MESTHNPQHFQAPFQSPAAPTASQGLGGTATATPLPATLPERCQELQRLAEKLYERNPDWVTFFREVLGVGGAARRYFPSAEALAEFETSQEYAAIQQMVAQLRQQNGTASTGKVESREPTRVITVRLPKCLHESLKTEAHERHTSMNKLCISKLLQVIDGQYVPTE